MYRLLIVDDEQSIREGIAASMPWPELGFEVAGLCANGEEALQRVQTDRPDVVLSDIRMPKMDGIALMQALKKHYPEIKFIILSGYSDFEYLNMSIKNNVTDYLLKPTDLDEFQLLFRKLRAQLDEEKRVRDELEMMRLESEQGREYRARVTLIRLLRGYTEENGTGAPAQDIEEVAARYPLSDCVVVRVSADGRLGDEDWELYRLHRDIADCCNGVIGESGPAGGFFLDHEDWVTGILSCGNHVPEEMDGIARRMQERVRESLRITVSVGFSEECGSPRELAACYEQANCSVNQSVFLGAESVFFYTAFAGKAQPRYELFNIEILKLAVQKGDYPMMTAELSRVFGSFAAQSFKDYRYIDRICLEALYSVSRWARIYNVRFEEILTGLGADYGDIYRCDSLDKKQFFLTALLFALQKALAAAPAGGHGSFSVAQLVKQCIDNEFENNALSLEYAAQKVGKTPAYISKIFKAELGCNFSEYLLQKRLARAVELLCDPSLKVYEVAQQVGYVDTSNFIKVFKKQYGSSPNDYRLAMGMVRLQ